MANAGWCRGCGAKMLWMITADKKMIPVDYDPDIEKETQFDHTYMTSHFATCATPAEFRRKRRGKKGKRRK